MNSMTVGKELEEVDGPPRRRSNVVPYKDPQTRPGAHGVSSKKQSAPPGQIERAKTLSKYQERCRGGGMQFGTHLSRITDDVTNSSGKHKRKIVHDDVLEEDQVETDEVADVAVPASPRQGQERPIRRDSRPGSLPSQKKKAPVLRNQSRSASQRSSSPRHLRGMSSPPGQRQGFFPFVVTWLKTVLTAIWQRHILGKIALIFLAAALAFYGGKLLISAGTSIYYCYSDIHYGSPRTQQMDAAIGIQDDLRHPSHIIVTKVNHRLYLTDIAGKDPTKKIDYISGPFYGGEDDHWNISLRVVSGAKPGLQNIVIRYGNLVDGYKEVTLVNDGRSLTADKQ